MITTCGARDIVRNPSLLKIDAKESIIIEDKRTHKTLGVYLGVELAQEFWEYQKKAKLLEAARKIKENATFEHTLLEGSINDGL